MKSQSKLVQTKLKDFRNFLYIVWKHLNLPEPTAIQYDIADYIQHSSSRAIVSAFRGVGKSWITSAYVLWRLLLNPQLNILVVSASKNRADDFSTFCLRLLEELPLLYHLSPTDKQRTSKISFDVAPALASHQPSVKSLGINSQITGSRSDLVVADDIETSGNTQTQLMRDKLSESIKEFEAVIKPNVDSKILFLGTPQCEQSILNKLQDRGYKIRYWTARYPSEKQIKSYGANLAPIINNTWTSDLVGNATDPKRFDETDLLEREASYGKLGFNMQFQLDTTLADIDRYPIKLADLVIMSCNPNDAPEKIVWASSPELRHDDLPVVGLQGDNFYRPMQTQGTWLPYQSACMSIDPSGKGRDETAYAITKILNGNIFLVASGGFNAGYTDHVLNKLTQLAKKHKVNKILIEDNFGQGMFGQLLKPFLAKQFPCTIELVRQTTNKHRRILDTLEPLISQHRLVVDLAVVKDDYELTNSLYSPETALRYQLMYQLSRLQKGSNTLLQDDRIDALQISCQHWISSLAKDDEMALKQRQEDQLDAQLERYWGVGRPNSWIRL